MAVLAVSHAADNRVLVGHLGQLRQQFANADSRDIGFDRMVERPGVVGARLWLGIKRVGVCGPAGEPDLDDCLGGRLAAGRSGRRGGRLWCGRATDTLPQQESAQTHRPAFQQLAAREPLAVQRRHSCRTTACKLHAVSSSSWLT